MVVVFSTLHTWRAIESGVDTGHSANGAYDQACYGDEAIHITVHMFDYIIAHCVVLQAI